MEEKACQCVASGFQAKIKKRKVVMSTLSNSTSIFRRGGDNLIGHSPKGVQERFVTVLC